MKKINVIKIGNMVKLSLSGKLHQKNCGSSEEATELMRVALTARENPTEDNIRALRSYLNEKLRVALMAGLETDPETNEVYLAGFNTPVPAKLVEVAKDYHDNGFPLDAIINFWKLLMINPDHRVRTSLFDFISTHDFSLTDKGYMVVYKAVYRTDEANNGEGTKFAEFVSNQVLKVKKSWKESPKNYVVYRNEDGEYAITAVKTAEKWNEADKGVEVLGNLNELFNSIYVAEENTEASVPVYTDMHTRSMHIELGKPVSIERVECDSDPSIDCSYGLHCGATRYVENFASRSGVILACLVNPANVVAVPKYDHSKMRVSEYFPFAYATYEDGKIDIVEQAYYEDDYCQYELEELEAEIAKVQASELPIETARNAEAETRPMSELMKMLESRLVDIE